MSKSDFLSIYHRFVPESFRIPLYTARKKSYRSLVSLLDKNVIHMSERLSGLRNVYWGERCLIMGNGPSLNKMKLQLFENDFVWGSNRCYLLFDRIEWKPRFYVAIDKRVVPDNAIEINELSRQLPNTSFFYPVSFRYNKILQSAPNVYWYNEISLNEENLPYTMFSTDLPEFVYSARTVTVAMLQLAVYLGFNPIYLIGCDTSYTVPGTIKYENGDPNLLISTGADPNHFDSSYFGKDKKWHDPHVDRMIFHYEQARKVCAEVGVQVFNATVGGNLEVFPRVNYLDLF